MFDRDCGDNQFDDALKLLGLPKLRKWSLECDTVQQSSVRCIPPKSSCVEETEICCPNIPIEDFGYLVSIPRQLKALRWKGKAWTCHSDMDDISHGVTDDGDDESSSESTVECDTISVRDIVSSLQSTKHCLEELAIEYAFIGTCDHADSRPVNLRNFEHLKKLKVSPQVLRGFHRCFDREMCPEECVHLQHPMIMTTNLPPEIQQLTFWMQTDGNDLADLISYVAQSHNSSLRRIVLISPLHCWEQPDHKGDAARVHKPPTMKTFQKLRRECSSFGLDLDSCCYDSCFKDIARNKNFLLHSRHLPDDVVMDEAKVTDSWDKTPQMGQRLMLLEASHQAAFSKLPA